MRPSERLLVLHSWDLILEEVRCWGERGSVWVGGRGKGVSVAGEWAINYLISIIDELMAVAVTEEALAIAIGWLLGICRGKVAEEFYFKKAMIVG